MGVCAQRVSGERNSEGNAHVSQDQHDSSRLPRVERYTSMWSTQSDCGRCLDTV
jgi:hypothetical protein